MKKRATWVLWVKFYDEPWEPLVEVRTNGFMSGRDVLLEYYRKCWQEDPPHRYHRILPLGRTPKGKV